MNKFQRFFFIIGSFISLTSSSFLAAQSTELYLTAGDSIVIKSGEFMSIKGLTLLPTADFVLSQTVTKQATLTNTASGTYIPIVYGFNTTTSNFSGQIKISYAGEATASEANYKIQYHNGAHWNRDIGSTVDIDNDFVTSSFLSNVVLNELTVSDMSSVLPLIWQSFKAQKVNGNVFLKWSTVTELNTKYFEIQHSANTTNWNILGSVQASGNSSSIRNYTFTHLNATNNGPTNFYRILLRDESGQMSYSSIIRLSNEKSSHALLLYPNPVQQTLIIEIAESQELNLVNMAGVVVWSRKFTAGMNQVDLSQFPKGLYFLKGKYGYSKLLID